METLRAELALAKEQARISNAAALKAAEELKAEKAAHGESRDKMAKMAIELKAAVKAAALPNLACSLAWASSVRKASTVAAPSAVTMY